jgi:hypothetical protein
MCARHHAARCAKLAVVAIGVGRHGEETTTESVAFGAKLSFTAVRKVRVEIVE